MKAITLKPCCALCGSLWDKEKCPLYETYNAASNYGDDTFDEKAKYAIRCDCFILNTKYQQQKK